MSDHSKQPTRAQASPGSTVTRSCPEHGTFQARIIVGNVASKCPVCEAEERVRVRSLENRNKAAQLQASTIRLMKQSCIPPRYADKDFSTYATGNAKQEANLSAMRRYAEKWPTLGAKLGTSLLLIGSPGTGKTHLALAVANHVIREHQQSALYTTVYRMVRTVKDTWRGGSTTESQAVDTFVEPSLLVLDEVGVQWGSETELIVLFDVLNRRYEERKPVILISNLDLQGVETVLGPRVLDRVYEDGGAILAFDWPSHRRRQM